MLLTCIVCKEIPLELKRSHTRSLQTEGILNIPAQKVAINS